MNMYCFWQNCCRIATSLDAYNFVYSAERWGSFLTMSFLVDTLCSLPLFLSIFVPVLRVIFIPTFLQIWFSRELMNESVNFLQRVSKNHHSIIFYKVIQLIMTLLCVCITCMGFVNHLERAGKTSLNLLDTFWFVIVTFSTVGYGDVYPNIWPSKVVVILMIFVALGIIPIHIEQIAVIYLEQQRMIEYTEKSEKHVVLCTTELRYDSILGFLNEFYEVDEHNENYSVVILCPNEPEPALKRFLQAPLWASRVTTILGSTYRDEDLRRAKVHEAEAVFVLTDRACRKGKVSRATNDEHTVLRSMAIKDFAPHTKLYVQCLRCESPFYLQFADDCLCDEELKYALLALNCDIPGMSTFVTLIIHTAKGIDDDVKTDWKVHINRSAGMEIYDVVAKDSKFFGRYIDHPFPQVASNVHRKTGAILFAVERDEKTQLNPGKKFIIQEDDILYYVCLTHENDSCFTDDSVIEAPEITSDAVIGHDNESSPRLSSNLGMRASAPFEGNLSEWTRKIDEGKEKLLTECKHDFPPQSPYLGYITPTLCYIRKLPVPGKC